ncbi:MAG: hypothetical protein A2X29_09545 [Elusimicrobia bacterium GWA2_64_40]|nr:MAG: hypothetical protein A2X29_09545 [Elusimicrobia bacterium GWA2_64_40]
MNKHKTLTPILFVLALIGGAGLSLAETGFGPAQTMDLAETIKEARQTPVPGLSPGIPAEPQLVTDPGLRRGSAGFPITGTDLGPTGWDFVDMIETFQTRLPKDVARYFSAAGPRELVGGISKSYESEIRAGSGGEKEKVVIELTRILIDAPFSVFQKKLPAGDWGLNIAHRLGGEVLVTEKGADGRVVRQLERMVLSGVPCAAVNLSLTNQDMTKAEIIRYGKDSAKVYWRVYRSDNGSTKVDVGSVEFRTYGESSVLVTFHSAHRLRGLEFLPGVAKRVLSQTFLDHARRYRDIALSHRLN